MKLGAMAQSVLLTLIPILFAAPQTTTAAAGNARRPIKLNLVVDRSDSICVGQRAAWKTTAVTILQGVKPGDLVEIRAITDVTDGAAPLFRGIYPVRLGSGRTYEEYYKKEVEKFRQGLLHGLNAAFAPPGDRKILASDIFSTFREIGPEGEFDPVAVYFSDMLHVDPPSTRAENRLNLESLNLSTVKPALIQRLADTYRWTSETLRGTRVYVVLNDATLCPASTRNRTGDVRAFYDPLIKALGGKLADFSTVWKGAGL